MGRGGHAFPFFSNGSKAFEYIESSRRYCCSTCRCHAASHDEIISKVRTARPLHPFAPAARLRARRTDAAHPTT